MARGDIVPGDGDPRHGTPNGYGNLGCRCKECTKSNNRFMLKQRRNRKERLLSNPTLRPHGLVNTYFNWMCRCDECRTAHTEWERERRAVRKRSKE